MTHCSSDAVELSFQTITVTYATANGTATAGSDYVAASGSVTFNPGETSNSCPSVTGDNIDEIHETFFVNMTNPTNATIGPLRQARLQMMMVQPSVLIPFGYGGPHTVSPMQFYGYAFGGERPERHRELFYGRRYGNFERRLSAVFSSTLFIPAGQTSGTLQFEYLATSKSSLMKSSLLLCKFSITGR